MWKGGNPTPVNTQQILAQRLHPNIMPGLIPMEITGLNNNMMSSNAPGINSGLKNTGVSFGPGPNMGIYGPQMNGPQLGVNSASISSGAGVGNGWGVSNNQMNSYMHIQSQQQHPQHQYSQQQNSRQKSTMHHHQPNQQPGYGKEASGPPIGPPPYGAQS